MIWIVVILLFVMVLSMCCGGFLLFVFFYLVIVFVYVNIKNFIVFINEGFLFFFDFVERVLD